MKTEREMLVLAAKAASINLEEHQPVLARDGQSYLPPVLGRWNPLADDGDAFRLVVMLGLDIEFGNKQVWWCQEDMKSYIMHPFADDRAAATRRVIVESAAAIGESMP